ncbi:hypothetical protein ACXGQW_11585 [Wenyingzhuangia sp. IMCC45533]
MKKNIFLPIFVFFICLLGTGCGDHAKKDSTPSISENSNRTVNDDQTKYAEINPKKLLKQIEAHYQLDEFSIAKDKLNYLIRNDSIAKDSLSFVIDKLKVKIDYKLKQIQRTNAIKEEIARNKRLSNSLEKMRIEKQGDTDLYVDLTSPEFETKECFYTYLKVKNEVPQLFLKIRYIDVDPLKIQDFIINIDKLEHTFNGDIQSSVTKGKKEYYIELLDKEITSKEDLEAIHAISSANEVIALYVGELNYRQREISEAQKLAIKNVLDAYAYFKLKSKIN